MKSAPPKSMPNCRDEIYELFFFQTLSIYISLYSSRSPKLQKKRENRKNIATMGEKILHAMLRYAMLCCYISLRNHKKGENRKKYYCYGKNINTTVCYAVLNYCKKMENGKKYYYYARARNAILLHFSSKYHKKRESRNYVTMKKIILLWYIIISHS